MPYRGRPSAGCQICRQRRIKCDQREGGCGNCQRAKWECPGYRNVTDLLFHDESASVVKKAKAAKPRRTIIKAKIKSAQSSDVESIRSTPRSEDAIVKHFNPKQEIEQKRLTVNKTLLPNLDELSLAYFFNKYVFQNTDQRGSWIIEDDNGCLIASMRALGTAGLTQIGNGPSLSSEAQSKYLSAIRLVNEALGSDHLAKRDSTLQAINLLGIFETITGFNRSLDAWRDHVHGAAALLQLRGAEQFSTSTGGRLFIQTAATLVTSCMQRRLSIPVHVWEMMRVAESVLPDPEDGTWRFQKTIMQFADLYARLSSENKPKRDSDIEGIIQEALELQETFTNLLNFHPLGWEYDVVYATGSTIFAGYYHIYRSFLPAQMLNVSRAYLMLLRDIISKALINADTSNLHLSATQKQQLYGPRPPISRLQLDILASVPQHLSSKLSPQSPASSTSLMAPNARNELWTNFPLGNMNPFRGTHFNTTPSSHLPFVRLGGGYLIQYPLYIAGLAAPPGDSLREFVINTLKWIGKTMGVKQALILSSRLEMINEQIAKDEVESFENWIDE